MSIKINQSLKSRGLGLGLALFLMGQLTTQAMEQQKSIDPQELEELKPYMEKSIQLLRRKINPDNKPWSRNLQFQYYPEAVYLFRQLWRVDAKFQEVMKKKKSGLWERSDDPKNSEEFNLQSDRLFFEVIEEEEGTKSLAKSLWELGKWRKSMKKIYIKWENLNDKAYSIPGHEFIQEPFIQDLREKHITTEPHNFYKDSQLVKSYLYLYKKDPVIPTIMNASIGFCFLGFSQITPELNKFLLGMRMIHDRLRPKDGWPYMDIKLESYEKA